ncbi:P-loop containing nucleoside triphosphate hydrolase protein [Mycena albidolilacea]|uniref:DNA 3'-5' helicase n=1 Tax=Mycena albidolilacea TaxID=1033008 RepID=A0AAD6ZMH6_9AGAR|nr:P-loop containing nucleoside triphosphate hydrolase protein [Mycena albidolilacea]
MLALWPFLILLLCSNLLCAHSFRFYSPKGSVLVRQILLTALPTFEPHIYQLEGVCKVLDKIDLVAVTPTGSGKTGFLFLTILVMIAIAANPSLCPSVKFPRNPAVVVVCPTNSIEQQMEENMSKLGILALMINAETVASARLRREDLWTKAREAVSMLILGPEQLISKGFQDLLKHGPFFDRVCALGVDEIHLLVMWGISFRKAFTQIGFMRARFRSGIPIIGLTATLLDDPKVADAIFGSLGVNRGEFHLIRRSNARHDIQILFRTLYSGIDGLSFPELAWVLKNNDKTLMFGATISLVFRIKTYLNSLLPPGVDRELRIRTYHSINWSDENIETISLFKSDARCQIIVATNGLAQGTDIPGVKTVIQIGEPESAEMFVQKPGRARPGIPNPRAIFYISATRHAKALKILSQSDAENTADAKKDGVVAMDRPVADILAARCKPAIQDQLYANPVTDPECLCQTCHANPPTPRPTQCRCSGCLPETSSEVYTPSPKITKAVSNIPQGQRLTKDMKLVGTSRLKQFRVLVWSEAVDQSMALTPLADFLPDVTIKFILDNFAQFKSAADLLTVVQNIEPSYK